MKPSILGMLLFLLAVLTAGSVRPAYAAEEEVPEIMASIPNRSGGKILLLSHDLHPPCRVMERGRSVIAYSKDGEAVTEGCWEAVGEEFIKIRWDDGEVKLYPIQTLEVNEAFINWVERYKASSRVRPGRSSL